MAVDDVRLLIGDMDSTYLSDANLTTFLTANGNNDYLAAADAAESIAAQLALKGNRKVEDISVSYDPSHFRALAKRLRTRAAMTNLVPYAGGISIADKDTQTDDTDRVAPAFTRELHSYPGLSPNTSDEDE